VIFGVIYKITNNLNEKVYIGQTIKLAQTRWESHLHAFRYGRKSKLYDAMRELGESNFRIEILTSADSRDELDRLEKQFIKMYDSQKNGYNGTSGGQQAPSWTVAERAVKLYGRELSAAEISAATGIDQETLLKAAEEHSIENIVDENFYYSPYDDDPTNYSDDYGENSNGDSLSEIDEWYERLADNPFEEYPK
jgi:group I intron endonuclease